MVGLVVFTVASLGAVLAPSLGMLVVARVAQGISSGIVEPAISAVIKSTFRSANSASLLYSQARPAQSWVCHRQAISGTVNQRFCQPARPNGLLEPWCGESPYARF